MRPRHWIALLAAFALPVATSSRAQSPPAPSKAEPQEKGKSNGAEGAEAKPATPPGPERPSGRPPGEGRRGGRNWEPRPAKLSDWKITAAKTETEEKGGQKILRYTDKVHAEMTIEGTTKIVVEAPRLVSVATGDTPLKIEAAGGFKASVPPFPGGLEADQFEASFDQGWPQKIVVPKEIRLKAGFGPVNVNGRAARLEVEFKGQEPQKGLAKDVSFDFQGVAGPWSGGSARVKEIRGSRETNEVNFEEIRIEGDHVTGGFAAKADHGRVRSRRFRLFGNVTFSLGEETFQADVVEFGEGGEPIVESKDDKQSLDRILQSIGARR